MVTSTCRAPAWTAASVLAVARPRSLWQWTLTTAPLPDAVDDARDERAELGRDGIADGVRDVDGGRAGIDDRLVDLQQELGSVRDASSALNSISASGAERFAPVAPPTPRPAASASSRSMRSLCLRWMSRGRDEDVQVRPFGDADRLDGPLRVAVAAARQRGHRDPPFVSLAMRWTASKSPGEAAGKPASITSTLRRTSWRATSSFSAAVRPAPGACSPSRSVVSKTRTRPGATSGPVGRRYAARSSAGSRGGPRPRLGLAGRHLDRVQERHLGAQLGADLLDLVVAVGLRACALNSGRPVSFSAIQRVGERAVLDLGEHVAHRARGRRRR